MDNSMEIPLLDIHNQHAFPKPASTAAETSEGHQWKIIPSSFLFDSRKANSLQTSKHAATTIQATTPPLFIYAVVFSIREPSLLELNHPYFYPSLITSSTPINDCVSRWKTVFPSDIFAKEWKIKEFKRGAGGVDKILWVVYAASLTCPC